MNSLRIWMNDCANILFDDSKNDLRALPKSVRLQFYWSLVLFGQQYLAYTFFLTQILLLDGLVFMWHT